MNKAVHQIDKRTGEVRTISVVPLATQWVLRFLPRKRFSAMVLRGKAWIVTACRPIPFGFMIQLKEKLN